MFPLDNAIVGILSIWATNLTVCSPTFIIFTPSGMPWTRPGLSLSLGRPILTRSPQVNTSWKRRNIKRYILTHWGRVTQICVSKLTIIGSDNGLSPGRRQAIIWTNAGILLIRPLGTNFNEILVEILTFLFMKMRLKVSFAKWRPFCLGFNVLILCGSPHPLLC